MPRTGDSIDRYLVEGVLGEGGMGRVYRALDPRLGRRVALKVLLPDGKGGNNAEASARMMREARAAAAFNHPNVVAIYDVGETDGAPFIAMELVTGRSLRSIVGSETESGQRVAWLLDVARGLAAAHRAGLVHRDIKPDNVMITGDGVVKILDFGIARRSDAAPGDVDAEAPTAAANLPSITAEGGIIGTPQYMAPEQLRGEPVDGRCDQFAWGVMAWELLAGKSPWGGTTNPAVLLTAVLSTAAPPLQSVAPDVSVAVSDAIARAMSKDRGARFPTMDDLVAAIDPRQSGAPRAAPAKTETTSVVTVPTRKKAGWLYPALVVLILGGAGFAATHGSAPRTAVAPATPDASSAQTGAASASAAPPPPITAGPEETLFPCNITKRKVTLSEGNGTGCGDAGAWCDTDGRQVACCPSPLVARTHEGTCECPPGGVPSDAPPGRCPRAATRNLPPDVIQSVVRANFSRVRRCYEETLKRYPDEKGQLKVYFEIGPDGRVFYAHIQGTTLMDPVSQSCMLNEFRKLVFPPPPAGAVTVVYPINFSPKD